jgi:hypothetical protein
LSTALLTVNRYHRDAENAETAEEAYGGGAVRVAGLVVG